MHILRIHYVPIPPRRARHRLHQPRLGLRIDALQAGEVSLRVESRS